MLADSNGIGGLRLLMRGSAHIRTQARLLAEEEQRTGAAQDRPSAWMIEREQREYDLADRIVVLSSFARDSFVAQGVPPDKLRLLPLGAALDAFRPSPATVEARRQRILSGAPLRVLYVGAIAFQKGLWDLAEVARSLAGECFELRLVGPQLPEAAPILAGLDGLVTVVPKQPQAALPGVYAWADVFVFPTIQDGYAMVLAQAAAAGLPIVTTSNCAGPDLVREGESGWVVPIRSPRSLAERLRWCEAHRPELARLAERVAREFQPRDWAAVAADFEAICGA
jgi:glycosyltransferase involved in cell wall biosynthesis